MPDKIVFQLPYEPPFDWSFLLDFLRRRQTAGVESISADRYARTAAVEGDVGIVTVEHRPERHRLEVTVAGPLVRHRDAVEHRVRHMFDLDLRQGDIDVVFSDDPVLGPLRRAYPGLRVPGAWSPFEALLRTIVGQQVSVAAATTIAGRIAKRTAPALPADLARGPALTRLFPEPEAVAGANLDAIGMPGRRVEALQTAARWLARQDLDTVAAAFRPGAEGDGSSRFAAEVKAALLQLPGIGPWTAEFFALRAFGDKDAWPGSDLILRRQLEQRLQRLRPGAERAELRVLARETADRWRPLRAYGAIHLWWAAADL